MQSIDRKPMSTCHLIVCEKTSHWAAALRPGANRGRLRVVETRSLSGCREALAAAPASVVAIHANSTNVEAAIEFLIQSNRYYPRAVFAALLGPDETALCDLLQEAGAIDVLGSVLDAPRLARLALRHFALLPQQEVSLPEMVAERMPWKAYSTTNG